ncbi:MAG: inositol 2-dehydrogenase [Sphingomonas sp. SCN 67-18]|uniref:Gfo/Idh/MocA family protein n=1 Tax=uncultured Sphingomonas sp. TaxID=158754 RepID=UPI00086BC6FD|nr:Gfo/Idh/MocA family oxidoreductase [Sphingomonas sp. SCN 67-18]ODU21626.1 MAG: inositol 2-dehydrogenase [Sphingomonas sp. SCN 67-18]
MTGEGAIIRIAQLGAGRMGSVHARNAAANPRLDLAWIVDPRAEMAAALGKETGATPAPLAAVLADPAVKGVIVASSTDAHLDDTRACLAAGKAVFCEKPLDLSLERLDSVAADFARPGLPPLFVAFNRRFDPHYQALKRRLDGGEIGALESLQIVNHDPETPPPAFIPGSGGLFKDFTIHDFDLVRWLVDEPVVEIFAWASCLIDPEIAALGDVDTAKLLLRTASGKLCVISNSRRTGYGYDQRIEAFGSKGALRVDNVTNTAVSVWRAEGAQADAFPYAFIQRYADGYRAELDHFADVLAGLATPETGYAASRAALAMAEAAALSAQEGRPVSISVG